jgi:hypothetical protein
LVGFVLLQQYVDGQSVAMARLRDLVFDCHHPATLARFWSSTLDGYQVAPYDDTELERLAELGIDNPEDDPTVLVEPSDSGLRLWFQKVQEPKTSKNRVHLDLSCDDLDAELGRLQALGASVQPDQPNDHLIVLKDPEGNEFCLLR